MQEQTGVNRFAYEMCRALRSINVSFTLLCPHGEIKQCYSTTDFVIRHCGFGRSHIWEQIALPIYFCSIRGKKILVNFTGLSPLLIRHKYMTIHDMAYRVNPTWYSPSYAFIYRLLTPLCARTAQRILTVSEFSKSEIMRWLKIPESKIFVIYNAVSSRFTTDYASNTNTKEQYILAVSSLDPRKNFLNLLKAFSLIQDKDIKLYVIGGENSIYRTSMTKLNDITYTERVKWLGRVNDSDLVQYYRHAELFIYPSLYEGFGIPPIEAMACGTPVVVSHIAPLIEVCGDAAAYINPLDIHDIAAIMTDLLHNADRRNVLKTLGSQRVKLFSWQDSANKLADLLHNKDK